VSRHDKASNWGTYAIFMPASLDFSYAPCGSETESAAEDAGPSGLCRFAPGSPRVYSGFTVDFNEILHRVAFEGAGGDTALVDTVYGSLQELRSGVHSRKALLVISDGMDNHSRYSRQELLDLAMESDAQVYTIAVGNAAPFSKPIQQAEEKRGLLLLDDLAAKTGGMSFIVRGQTDIGEAAATIGRALRNQYTIGYVPGNGRRGQWRRIRVKVEGSGLRAYARAGYRLD
jgi:Ca-activated chloride channel family protein